jgi:hypothetical protein
MPLPLEALSDDPDQIFSDVRSQGPAAAENESSYISDGYASYSKRIPTRLALSEGGWDLPEGLGLQLLHETRTTDWDLDRTVDIIFVHGLGRSARKTWTHKRTNNFWPSWLHESYGFENCRIFMFGYDANINILKKGGNTLELRDFANSLVDAIDLNYYRYQAKVSNRCSTHTNYQTPLVFVAHSLGGLIVKQVTCKIAVTDGGRR